MSWGTLRDPSQERELFQRRAFVAIIAVVVLTGVLVGRFYYLQIIEHETYTTISDRNRVQVQPVPPTRGLIYDRNGVLLAENRPVFSLTVIPEQVPDMGALIRQIRGIVDVPPADVERFRQRLEERRRPYEPVPLRYHLTESEMARLAVNRHRLPGVETEARLVRYYPYGRLTSHVLGYVGRINEKDARRIDEVAYAGTHYIGKTGLERVYEQELHGEVGYQNVETNARGRVMRVLEREDPSSGSDLTLNLDIRLQQVAHEALGDRRGAIVAIDPETGGLLAQVSTPGFDTNKFVTGIDHDSYSELRNSLDKPLFNRATRGQYPPGSTVKPMLAIAGLASDTVTQSEIVYDPGYYKLPNSGKVFRNWKRGGHGETTLYDAIVLSSDTYFYKMAYEMGGGTMADYLAPFGFGSVTSLDVRDERPGILPSPEWKRRVHDRPWYPGDSVNMGIGQGYFLSTPMQLAATTSVLANRGERHPPRHLRYIDGDIPARHLLPDVVRPPVEMGTESDWEYVINAMEDVVHGTRGTARRINRGLNYRMAGKTGTSQVFSLEGEEYDEDEIAKRMRDHALFVAFAPVDDPEIAVSVLVENGGSGSATAAPVAREVTDAWINGFPDMPTGQAQRGTAGREDAGGDG
ncbi:penicillin-binding protein 2 [Halomonadaceae bacterium KBTZ08]